MNQYKSCHSYKPRLFPYQHCNLTQKNSNCFNSEYEIYGQKIPTQDVCSRMLLLNNADDQKTITISPKIHHKHCCFLILIFTS